MLVSTTVVSTRSRRPRTTRRSRARETVRIDDAMERLRPEQGGQADQCLGVRNPLAVDPAERAVDQAAADFPFALGEAPVEEVLEDQHPEDHDHRRAEAAAARALRAAPPEGGVDEV